MINPTEEQLAEIMKIPGGKAFVMLNLLKFSDEEAYNKYAGVMLGFLQKFNARPLWAGEAAMTFIGTGDETWDKVLLIEYPSREAFISMISSPEYSEYNKDREAGLERMALVLCRQQFMAAPQ